MNYSKIKKNSVGNWEGISVTLYVQGCQFHCKGCFNKEAWCPYGGEPFTDEVKQEIFEELEKPYYDNFVLCGGEVTHENNIDECTKLAKEFKERFPNKKLVMFTGAVYEDIKDKEILRYVDYMIDGQFKIELYSPKLFFKGSSNQRTIDMNKTRAEGKVVLYHE